MRGAGERHRAGWDITFSTPKSFGILWAAGTPEQRAVLESIQQDAVDQALQLMMSERLGRSAARRRGTSARERRLISWLRNFRTSRRGRGTLHAIHIAFLLNVARRRGTRYLTVEPKRTYEWQLVLGSAFRSALSERLAEIGFSLRDAGRDQFEIAGIPGGNDRGVSRSVRSKSKHVLERDASAAQKEVAALATRRDKATVPTGDDLEKRWKQEFAAFEIDPWTVALEAGLARNPTASAGDRPRL